MVAASVRELPAEAVAADPTCAARAEAMLVDLAGTHDAKKLRQLGRHILHVLDPEQADRRLGRQLEREERAATRRPSSSCTTTATAPTAVGSASPGSTPRS